MKGQIGPVKIGRSSSWWIVGDVGMLNIPTNLGLNVAGGWTPGNLPHKRRRLIYHISLHKRVGSHLGFRDEHECFKNHAWLSPTELSQNSIVWFLGSPTGTHPTKPRSYGIEESPVDFELDVRGLSKGNHTELQEFWLGELWIFNGRI